MEGYLTQEVVDEIRCILKDATYRKKMVEHNYRIATRHFSYAELRRRLRMLIANMGNLYPS
jgi:hypothetical protein